MVLGLVFFLTILIIFSKVVALGVLYRAIASLFIVFSLYYCVRVLQFPVKKSPFAFGIIFFCIVYTLYTILSIPVPNENISKWGMLMWVLSVQLSFFPTYYFTVKGKLDEETFLKLFKVLFCVSVLCFFGNYYNLMNNPLLYASEGFTNNMGYYVLMLLPYTFLLKRRISIVYIYAIFALVLFSMKRGAILILLLSFFLYQIISNRQAIGKIVQSIVVSVIGFLGVFALLYNNYFKGNDYFEKRVEQTIEMDTSGRDEYGDMFFSEIHGWDGTSLFLGRGVNYSFKILDNFAHNDWFELFYTMGFIGLFVYAFYFITLYFSRKYCRISDERNIISTILVIMLVQTLVSMLFFDHSLCKLSF